MDAAWPFLTSGKLPGLADSEASDTVSPKLGPTFDVGMVPPSPAPAAVLLALLPEAPPAPRPPVASPPPVAVSPPFPEFPIIPEPLLEPHPDHTRVDASTNSLVVCLNKRKSYHPCVREATPDTFASSFVVAKDRYLGQFLDIPYVKHPR